MGSLHRCLDVSRYKQFVLLTKLPGAKLDLRDYVGRTAMHRCALMDNEETAIRLILVLLTHRADPYAFDHQGRSILHYACQRGHYRLAEILIEVIPELDAGRADCYGNDALHYAAATGNDRLVALLLHHFALQCIDVDRPNAFGFTPLLIAASNGHRRVASLLATAGSACRTRRDGVYFMSAYEWLAVFFHGVDTRVLAEGQDAHLSPRDATEVLQIAGALSPAPLLALQPQSDLTQWRAYSSAGRDAAEHPALRCEKKWQSTLPSQMVSEQKTVDDGVLGWQRSGLAQKGHNQSHDSGSKAAMQSRPTTAPVRLQLQPSGSCTDDDNGVKRLGVPAASLNCSWPRCTSASVQYPGTSRKSRSAWEMIQELATIQPQQLSPSYRTTAVYQKLTPAPPPSFPPDISQPRVRDHAIRARR